MLVILTAAGAVDGNYDEGICGDDVDVEDVVEFGYGGGIGVEEVADGDGSVVRRVGSEGKVGVAGRAEAVADVAIGGRVVLITIKLFVVFIGLLP